MAFGVEEKHLQQIEQAKQYIVSTAKWMRFFGVMGIVCALMMLSGAIVILKTTALGLIYLIFVPVYIVPVVYCFKAASAAMFAVECKDNLHTLEFFKINRNLWRFYGILIIVVFGLIALSMLVVLLAYFFRA